MTTPRTQRAERLLDLISFLLASDRPIGWGEIRQAFPGDYLSGTDESCLRKFERDKTELMELGIPVEFVPEPLGGGGGYRIDKRQYYLPPLDFTAEERTLLSVAGAAALDQAAFPLREDLGRALGKLFFSAPVQRGFLRRALEPPSEGQQESLHLDLVGQAAASRQNVRISYRSYEGASTEREVSPYGIAFRSGAWFLVGFCHLRKALRTFVVARIIAVERAQGSRRGADFEVPKDFDLRSHVGTEAWELGLHPRREVRLLVGAGAAPLARNAFGESAAFQEGEDGSLEVTISVTNEEAIVRLVLRMAPHARILSPPQLREKLRLAAGRIAERHEGVAEAEARKDAPEVPVPALQKRPPDLRQRIQRALVLIPHAVARSGCTVEELAEVARLGVDELLAELDFLRLVGRPPFSPADLVDIDVVDGRVHAALPQGFSKPPALTPLEAAALDAAASALAEEGGESLRKVRVKIRSAIPLVARERFDDLQGRFQVAAWSLQPAVARLLDEAIESRREISLQYFTATRGEASQRTVRPLRRFLHQGYWYLYAFCCSRGDRRLFRLDRATNIRLEEKTFLPRALDEAPLFGVQGKSVADFRVDSGPWAEPGFLMRLGAREVFAQDDGSAIATLPIQEEAYAISVILSLAGKGEVLGPPMLREKVREAAGAVQDLHR